MSDPSLLWREEKCPSINGIMFADGRYLPITFHYEGEIRHLKLKFTFRAMTTLNDRHHYETGIGVFDSVDIENGRAKCGCGALGGDGFVAVEDKSGDLIWLAFFDQSNPFLSLSVDSGVITAISEHKWKWHFPIHDPGAFWIEQVEWSRDVTKE